jgi:hypothetical protein
MWQFKKYYIYFYLEIIFSNMFRAANEIYRSGTPCYFFPKFNLAMSLLWKLTFYSISSVQYINIAIDWLTI